MNVRTVAAFALVATLVGAGFAEESKTGASGTVFLSNIKKLDPAWGLELTNEVTSTGIGANRAESQDVLLTLKFTKDVSDVKAIRAAFAPRGAASGATGSDARVRFFLFDKENVAFATVFVEEQIGEITGKAGEAFRVKIQIEPATFANVKNIDIRPAETPKVDPPKEPQPVVGVDQLEKTWNLKFKSSKPKDGEGKKTKDVEVTLEFTKDVSDVKAVRAAFAVPPAPAAGGPRVLFYLFDADNVVLARTYIGSQEGEITGKLGDAFRVTAKIDPAVYAKIKKIELRPSEPTSSN